MNDKKLKTLISCLKIVSAYIITNRDVLDADELVECEDARDNLIEIIAQLADKED